MISRATFSYILDGMKEYYDARTDIYDLEQTGSFGYGNLVDAEDVILTLLVESVDDRDGLIYDWLHGTIQTQEDGVVRYVDMEPQTRKPVYLPVGVFVTSYARYKTITSAQSVYDRFLYADTDSLHLLGTEIPEGLDVDPVRLGAWKHESTFTRAKFLRAKCYTEEIDERLSTHVAGMPANVHSQVTLDNFELGAIYHGKLYQKRVPGGIVLVPGDMQIRE